MKIDNCVKHTIKKAIKEPKSLSKKLKKIWDNGDTILLFNEMLKTSEEALQYWIERDKKYRDKISKEFLIMRFYIDLHYIIKYRSNINV